MDPLTIASMFGPPLSSGGKSGFLDTASEMLQGNGGSSATATSGLTATGSMTVTQGGSKSAQATGSAWILIVIGTVLVVLYLKR